MKLFFPLILAMASALAQAPVLSPLEQKIVRSMSADTLKGHVSFLASDALEGRDTPSKGLEVAAEYIASQFRRFGVEPAGNEGYFQTASFGRITPVTEGFEFTLTAGAESFAVSKDSVALDVMGGAEIDRAPVLKVRLGADPPSFRAEDVRGKAVVAAMPDFQKVAAEDRRKSYQRLMRDRKSLIDGQPALVIITESMGGGGNRLRDLSETTPPQVTIRDEALRKKIAEWPVGPVDAAVTAKIPKPAAQSVKLANVIGIVRGGDPALKDSYVLITSHYDHIGMQANGEDRINNGANDDASGTATVLQLAETFARLGVKPRRSIVFIAYFGEEKGLLGSRYYAEHPVFPLAKTVADLNLEHMGRTDDNEGPQLRRLAVTGMDYSNVGDVLKAAGLKTGVEVWRHAKNSDMFFSASDNQALADAGIPSHTLSVAYIFPDYHRPGDHWDKLDYKNMQQVAGTTALAAWSMANSSKAPAWSPANEKAQKYLSAWKALHANSKSN